MTTRWEHAAFWCAFGAAATSSVSIAASQSFLGLALAAMLAGRLRWRLPAHWPALAIFAGWTILSLAFSDAPRAGLPQIRKFYVWAMLFVVLSLFRSLRDVRWLAAAWLAGGTLSALRGLWQFAVKWSAAANSGQDFYLAYVGHRITGFMSHWMTFSGQMMIVLLFGAALLLWGKPQRLLRWALIACLPVVALALVLAFTRGVWIATAAGGVYLLWSWKRWTVALLPLAALLAFAAGPAGLRQRLVSLVRPHGQTDSNLHRVYTMRTGIEMIKAHPLLGLGPERVGPHFTQYVPPDLPKQLPEGYYGHLHNIYVHFAAERGLPAMLALVWFLVMNLRDWLSALRAGAGDGVWALRAGAAVLIGILVTGLFEYNLGDSEILAMTLASLGAAPVAYLASRSSAPGTSAQSIP
ncbi:MAG: O-antigen ligase family protein [Acidobacteria bacterium]|nr:O-antigen ligase family protein [Acidobacteriota bacterium]